MVRLPSVSWLFVGCLSVFLLSDLLPPPTPSVSVRFSIRFALKTQSPRTTYWYLEGYLSLALFVNQKIAVTLFVLANTTCYNTMMLRWTLLAGLAAATTAYQPGKMPANKMPQSETAAHAVAAATAALSLLLTATPLPAAASEAAAQIALNSLPPTSISIQIGDLPIVGPLLSGTYTKVPDGSIAKPSVTITSPTDKVKAISSIATGGHLEFDIGGIVKTHLDVDVASDEAGVAKIRVASPLVPKLPFRNLASSTAGSPTGGKESPWNVVTNMGTGESYYYNEKLGLTQFERPTL